MLPYQSMEQAKIAMGRELSASEKIWFNYSSQKPDIVLHSHNFLFLCFFYSIFPLPYIFLELIGSNHVSKFKIQPHINRSLWDMFRCYKSVMLTFVIAVCPLQVLSYPTLKWIGIRSGLPLPSGWEMCVQIMMYFLIEDYTHYWVHRMLHCKWWYQNIHYLHHQYTAPMALSAPYAHWAEILILGLPSFIGPALVPCHIITYWLWFVLRQMEATEIHSGYDFKWSPTKHIPFYGGAEYHDYHHYVGGQSHSNFASVFTYCDYIYGTDKGYRHQKSISKRKHL